MGNTFVEATSSGSRVHIALVGDYNPAVIAHQAIPKALSLAASSLNCLCDAYWVSTDHLDADPADYLSNFQGVWCVPASPYRSMKGALQAIRFARETPRPFLGTCGGFQHAVIEYARNVLGVEEADHGENNPGAEMPIIVPLACSLVEKEGTVYLHPGSLARSLCGTANVMETYHCSYGINPKWEGLLFDQGLKVAGSSQDGEVRVIEIPEHPFFVATAFQPERFALNGLNHPLVRAFVRATWQNAGT